MLAAATPFELAVDRGRAGEGTSILLHPSLQQYGDAALIRHEGLREPRGLRGCARQPKGSPGMEALAPRQGSLKCCAGMATHGMLPA